MPKLNNWRGDERILVFRSDDIGQMVTALPALRAIRETLPGARISLLTGHNAAGLMPCMEGVDEVIPFTTVWTDSRRDLAFDPEREEGFVDELKDGKYDAAIMLTTQVQSSLPGAYACYMAGIPLRLGRSAELAGTLLTHRLRGFGQGHEVERLLELVGAWSFKTDDPSPHLVVNEKVSANVAKVLKNHGVDGRPYAVVHTGAATGGRELPTEGFARAIVELHARFGYRSILTGLPQERLAAEWVIGESRVPALNMAGETSVADLAIVIAGARIVISANNTPAQIASAYGVPSVLLYDDDPVPEQWRPRSRSVSLRAADSGLGDQLAALLDDTKYASLAPLEPESLAV